MSTNQELLSRLNGEIQQRNLQPIDYFRDLDARRKGEVTEGQFLRALSLMNLTLTVNELNQIVALYKTNSGINYSRFLTDLQNSMRAQSQASGFQDTRRTTGFMKTSTGNHFPEVERILEDRKYNPTKMQYTTKPPIEGSILKDEPEGIHDLLAKLRLIVKQKRIRLNEFIRDYDRLRSGIITKSQLRSSLSMARIDLSNAEFETLCQEFGVDENRVRYPPLIDEIEKVFTEKNLEKTNNEVVTASHEPKYGSQPLSREERQLVEEVVRRFKYFTVNKVLDIKSHFQDWDRHNRMKISPKQFRQVLAQFNFLVSDFELNAICRKYNDDGNIRYLDFVNDSARKSDDEVYDTIEAPVKQTGSFNIHTPYCMNKPPDHDIETLLQKIQHLVRVKRIRAQEFMTEHDPLRKGRIPKAKFRSALDNMRIDLSPQELQMLEDYYSDTPDLANYAAFVELCEQVFTQKGLEKDPEVRLTAHQAPANLDPRDVLTDSEEVEMNDCMDRLGFQVKTRRILIKPFFQDKDKINAGWVTTTRFRSILTMANLPVSDREFELLSRRFAHRRNEVNYLEFVELLKYYSGDIEAF